MMSIDDLVIYLKYFVLIKQVCFDVQGCCVSVEVVVKWFLDFGCWLFWQGMCNC